jgi:HEAT repeat protein
VNFHNARLTYRNQVKAELEELGTRAQGAIRLAKVAQEIARLNVNDTNQQCLAVIALAQSDETLVIPVLFDVLRNQRHPQEIIAEALYGLGRFGSNIPQTLDHFQLILASSQHIQKTVRFAAVEAMGKIAPKNASFQTRLVEIINNDVDNDVKIAAKKVLGNGQA